ncbi:MAG TPA: sodium-translocating pyrophosphatase [Candidatus Limnocylindria bacterium]|nr:sodium-translocating pyrophosphatase [Candidatus Limnocylindria bacterium]
MDPALFLLFAAGAALFALLTAALIARNVLAHSEGNELVRSTGRLIREGAMAFLRAEYSILSVFVAVVAVLVAVLIDYNLLGHDRIAELNAPLQAAVGVGPWTALAYVAGALGSGLAGLVGMSIAVRGNTRTATAAQQGLNEALRVAFNTGTVMGLTVVGVGLLGIVALWLLFEDPNVVAGFGFGASSIALFARVGGGIYTKAADVGADLVGKVEAGIPEDDPRNPATIADNVGDNVGDVAGMGADLFESYVGAMIAALALTAAGAAFLGLTAGAQQLGLVVLPMAICGVGIVASAVATLFVRTGEQPDMSRLLWALRAGIFGAAGLALAGTAAIVLLLDLPLALLWVVLVGLVVGQVIGTATEFFTSYEYPPTRWISAQSVTGPASTTIAGVAVGLGSVVVPVLAVVTGIWLANELAGLYGVALAAVGMLSTLGITLATDAYGPVADNAGGLAQQAGLAPEVRERTDALDALGNTTAATGKGFAIGSAVLTALALMAAYTQVAEVDVLQLTDARILIGLALGGMLAFLFSSLTMHAVGQAANAMIEEVRRQFREIPGLLEGLPGVEPDAARAVDISTRGALRAMLLPGAIAVSAPVVVGVVLGAEALGGLLVGSITTGFLLATFMANAGGAWDNAKKWIEKGHHGGKGSDAHAAAVVGDTIGDPFKDTSGPSINILLKLMAVVALIFGPLFV